MGRWKVKLKKHPHKAQVFIHEHKTWFTIFGALIVFAAFFVKEGFHEEVKADRDQLHEAIKSQLVVNAIQSVGGLVKERGAINPETLPIDAEFSQMGDSIDVAKAQITLAASLAEKLPPNQRRRVINVEDLNNELSKTLDELIQFRVRLHESLPSVDGELSKRIRTDEYEYSQPLRFRRLAPSQQRPTSEIEKIALQWEKIKIDVRGGKDSTQRYYNQVTSLAEESLADKEVELRVVTYLEYACFVLGWLIGIVGKLGGIKGEATEA